jgi:hypothetical protein
VDVCTLRKEDVDRLRLQIEREVGISAKRVVIAGTHTHSGPAVVGNLVPRAWEYVEKTWLPRLLHVVREAARNVQPARLGFGSGREDTISHYRRLLADDGSVVMNWEPYPEEHILRPLGEIDPEVGVLQVMDQRGQNLCLLFNHAGHPNVLSGDNYLLSAEYPGLSERILEEQLGGTAMFLNGAQGTMDIDGLRDRDWEGMERVGRALATAVQETVATIEPLEKARIIFSAVKYDLPRRQVSDAEWKWAKEVLAQTGGTVRHLADGVGDDYRALLLSRLREKQDEPLAVEQIGFAVKGFQNGAAGAAFISFPGELFTEIGMRLKTESPFRHTYILGLANGHIGYVPTRKAIDEGGYAVSTRRVADEASEVIVRYSLRLLRDLYQLGEDDAGDL